MPAFGRPRSAIAAALLLAGFLPLAAPGANAGAAPPNRLVERISVAADGSEVTGESTAPSMSADGRYIAFASATPDITPGDHNRVTDVFVKDRLTGATERIGVDEHVWYDDDLGNEYLEATASDQPFISADGRYVAFRSTAGVAAADRDDPTSTPRWLVEDNSWVSVHDRQTGITTAITPDDVLYVFASGPVLSADGRFMAYVMETDDSLSIDRIDLLTGASVDVTDDSWCFDPYASCGGLSISADGRFVSVLHAASTHSFSVRGVYVRDAQSDTTVANVYDARGRLSPDGRLLVFASARDDVVAGDNNASSDVFTMDLQSGAIERLTFDPNGFNTDAGSGGPIASSDGRYVAFTSSATNLVAGDDNGVDDVFVHDRVSGITTMVSTDRNGAGADGPSSAPVINADGSLVAFVSSATDLVAGDTNGARDVFVASRVPEATPAPPIDGVEPERISVATGGAQARSFTGPAPSDSPAIDGDGVHVAFRSDADFPDYIYGLDGDVFRRTRPSGPTLEVAGWQWDGLSHDPDVDDSGSLIAYVATTGDEDIADIHLTDMDIPYWQAGGVRTVSTAPDGGAADGPSSEPAISGDGRHVVFTSEATNLVDGDTNSTSDVFVHDIEGGTTTIVSVAAAGGVANGVSDQPAISADGRYVAFRSDATDLVDGDTNDASDVFVRDLTTGTTMRVSVDSAGGQAAAASWAPDISADATTVAFVSTSDDLDVGTAGNADVFVHDFASGTTAQISTDLSGLGPASQAGPPSISGDGRFVTYAQGLPEAEQAFVHDRSDGSTRMVSVNAYGVAGDGRSWEPVISTDGTGIAFTSEAANLVPNDTNELRDVFAVENRKPAGSLAAVLVAGSTAPPRGDLPVLATAEDLGFDVTVVDDDTVDLARRVLAHDPDLVLLSSSVGVSTVGDRLTGLGVPLLTWEGYLHDDVGLAGPGLSGETSPRSTLRIVDRAHPLAAGLSGVVSVTAAPHPQSWLRPAGDATVVARSTDGRNRPVIAAWDVGDATPFGPAPARIVAMFLDYASSGYLTGNGTALLREAMLWVGAPGNARPVVDAGPDLVTRVPDLTLTLDASVTDDGLPGSIELAWSQVSGPAGVTFDPIDGASTCVSLPGVGTYVVRLSANDGSGPVSDDVTITVTPASVLYVAASTNPPAADLLLIERIEAAGADVTVVDDDTVSGGLDVTGVDAVFLSTTASVAAVGSSLHDVAVPLVTWEAYLHDDLGLARRSGESTTATAQVVIDDPADPLAGGLAGSPEIYRSANRLSWAVVGGDADVVAHEPGNSRHAVVWHYEAGDTLTDGTTAAADRYGLFADYYGMSRLTPAGLAIFDATIAAAIG